MQRYTMRRKALENRNDFRAKARVRALSPSTSLFFIMYMLGGLAARVQKRTMVMTNNHTTMSPQMKSH